MTDPVYEYRPGEGWVAFLNLVTMSCGTRVRFELRQPNDGERYICRWQEDFDNHKDFNEVNEYFRYRIPKKYYTSCTRRVWDDGGSDDNYVYATLIYVDG